MNKNFLAICLVALLGWSTFLLAELDGEQSASAIAEGLEYQLIIPPVPTQNDDGRIEVVELFLYACPHCNVLAPEIKAWAQDKSEYVLLRRVPAIVGAPWADQARVFYTAEKLGILEKSHPALFKSIHEDGEQYADDHSIMEFFVKQGIKEEDFLQVFRSPEVDEKVSQARILTVKYGIRGVPALIINGKYRTAQYFTGTQERLLKVLDMLVEKERVARDDTQT